MSPGNVRWSRVHGLAVVALLVLSLTSGAEMYVCACGGGGGDGDSSDSTTWPIEVHVSTGAEDTNVSADSDYNSTKVYTSGDNLIVDTVEDVIEVDPEPTLDVVLVKLNGDLHSTLNFLTPYHYVSGNFNAVGKNAYTKVCDASLKSESHHANWTQSDGFQNHSEYVTLAWTTNHDLDEGLWGNKSWSDNTTADQPVTHIIGNKTWDIDGEGYRGDTINVWLNRTVAVDYQTATTYHEEGTGPGVIEHEELYVELQVDSDCL